MNKPHPVEDLGPAIVDGALVRLITDDVTDWVEQWDGEKWDPGGAMVDEVLRGPRASPETLKRFGYPVGPGPVTEPLE